MSLFNTKEIHFDDINSYQKWILTINCPVNTYGKHKTIIHMEHPKAEEALKKAKELGGKIE